MSTTTELSEALLQLSSSASSSSSQVRDVFRRIRDSTKSEGEEQLLRILAARDNSGRSALHFACQHGQEELVATLFQHITDSQGGGVESSAALSQLLIAEDGLGQTALHWALKAANDAAKGANQSPTSSSSSSSSAAASTSSSSSSVASHLKCVSLILDVEERALQQAIQTPAAAAAATSEEQHVDKKAKLEHDSEAGAPASSPRFMFSSSTSCLFVRDSFGRVPLHWTVAFPDVLMRVIQLQSSIQQSSAAAGAGTKPSFIDTQTVSGETALHYAASDNNVAALDILLSAGASLELKNNRGESVMDVCRSDEARGVVSAWTEKARIAAEEKAAADAAAGKPKDELETVSASSLMAASHKSTTTASSGAAKKKVAIKLKK